MTPAATGRLPSMARGIEMTLDASYAGLPELAGRDWCPPGGLLVVRLCPPGRVDVATVGALARLLLQARRCAADLRVHAPDPELRVIVGLMGLCEVLGPHNSAPGT